MTSKFLRLSLVVALFFAISALAQTSSAATSPDPSAAPTAPAPSTPVTTGSGEATEHSGR